MKDPEFNVVGHGPEKGEKIVKSLVQEIADALAAGNIQDSSIASSMPFLRDLLTVECPREFSALLSRHDITEEDLDRFKPIIDSMESDANKVSYIFKKMQGIAAIVGIDESFI